MYARILVPIDGSTTAQRGLEEALALAAKLGSSLYVLNVVDARLLIAEAEMAVPPKDVLDSWQLQGERLVAKASEVARAKGVPVEVSVRCEPGLRVCDVIVKEAAERRAELIVMGTYGHARWIERVTGGVTRTALLHAPVPLWMSR